MELKSFGCSFIYGSDLFDSTDQVASSTSWPALIAKNQGWTYQCHARPGSGNLRILQSVLDHVKEENVFFLIGWTWIDRFDYTTTDDQWRSILPNDHGDVAGYFYRNLHSQYRDKITSLIYIKSALDALRAHDRQFVMTSMDPLLFETDWHTTPGSAYLQENIRPYIQDFQGKTFLDWSQDRGFDISDLWHPLEQAHLAAADYALNHWTGLV